MHVGSLCLSCVLSELAAVAFLLACFLPALPTVSLLFSGAFAHVLSCQESKNTPTVHQSLMLCERDMSMHGVKAVFRNVLYRLHTDMLIC